MGSRRATRSGGQRARRWLPAVALATFGLIAGGGSAAGAGLGDPGLGEAGLSKALPPKVAEAIDSADRKLGEAVEGTHDQASGDHPGGGGHRHPSTGSDFEPYHGGGDDEHGHEHARHERRKSTKRAKAKGKTAGKTTLERTIAGGDPGEGFQFLELADGEKRIVREDLAKAKSGRAKRRRSLLYVGQTTDWQLSDEESPSRVEFFDITANDPLPRAFSAAHRPQESLVPHGVEMSIRQLNRFTGRSPHTHRGSKRASMDFTILTGDQADNQQYNETRWVVQLLEGGVVDPNSGTDPASCPPGQMPQGQTADPRRYAGVQDYDDYSADGHQFYDPDEPAGIWGDWPTYPGLMDRAQLPFEAQGLDVPSYVTPGNHDGLAQGNEKALAPFEDVGIGCVKPLVPATSLSNPDDFGASLAEVLDPGFLAGLLTDNPGQVMFVPPDPDRRYVDKRQYKALYDTGAQPDAHGFGFVDPAELEASNGAASYYSWKAKPGIRMVSIDTLCEGGVAGPSANGNIDDAQFRWLESELDRAERRDELVIAFGHHPVRSLSCDVPDETPPPCTVDDEHGHDVNPGCDLDPRSSEPLHFGDDLTELFHEHPNVIAYIAGHTHEHTLTDFDREGGGPGDFWGIETASLVDWPPQNRLIELMDNCDGTLSFMATVIDSTAPATAPGGGTEASAMTTKTLASVERTLAYNDPQAGPSSGGQGEPDDRNVELLLNDPREQPSKCTRKAGSKRDTDSDREEPDEVEAAGGSGGGSLPFTGLMIATLALIGASLLAGGRLVRHLARIPK